MPVLLTSVMPGFYLWGLSRCSCAAGSESELKLGEVASNPATQEVEVEGSLSV